MPQVFVIIKAGKIAFKKFFSFNSWFRWIQSWLKTSKKLPKNWKKKKESRNKILVEWKNHFPFSIFHVPICIQAFQMKIGNCNWNPKPCSDSLCVFWVVFIEYNTIQTEISCAQKPICCLFRYHGHAKSANLYTKLIIHQQRRIVIMPRDSHDRARHYH